MYKGPEKIEEIVCNDEFLAWYFKTDAEKASIWASRIADNADLHLLSSQAANFINTIKVREKSVEPEAIEGARSRLMQAIEAKPVILLAAKKRRKFWMVAAAAVLFVALSWGAFQYLAGNRSSLDTRFGEISEERLPDGSEITLNANTRVSFAEEWENEGDREVWIQGEAFFKVKKTSNKSRFIVHTGHFDIVVTGTQFNVVNRNNRTNILLKEGSVILKTPNGEDKPMKPGDFVEYDQNALISRPVKDAQVTAWKEHKFIFEKTPMKEVAAAISELYGVTVTFGDGEAALESISGILPNDNLDIFLRSLDATQNFEATKDDKEIVIRKRR